MDDGPARWAEAVRIGLIKPFDDYDGASTISASGSACSASPFPVKYEIQAPSKGAGAKHESLSDWVIVSPTQPNHDDFHADAGQSPDICQGGTALWDSTPSPYFGPTALHLIIQRELRSTSPPPVRQPFGITATVGGKPCTLTTSEYPSQPSTDGSMRCSEWL